MEASPNFCRDKVSCMKERDNYLAYIIAVREKDKKSIQQLLENGFRPNRRQLVALAGVDPLIRQRLLNRTITIYLDGGQTAGHVYGTFPIYNSKNNTIEQRTVGFYPKDQGMSNALGGKGALKDEITETRRVFEQFETLQVTLPLTEEAWVQLAYWMEAQQEIRNYSLYKKNCVRFVHEALKAAGYSDGLVDKFNPSAVRAMRFKPIHIEMPKYYRMATLSKYIPGMSFIVRPEGISMGSRWKLDWYMKAERQREIANARSHANQINSFFETHHTYEDYQQFFYGKSFTYEDIRWLIHNKIPGMDYKIRAVLSQAYQNAPDSIQQRYRYTENNFIQHVIGYFLIGFHLPKDIQHLLDAVEIDPEIDGINRALNWKNMRTSHYVYDTSPIHIDSIEGVYYCMNMTSWNIASWGLNDETPCKKEYHLSVPESAPLEPEPSIAPSFVSVTKPAPAQMVSRGARIIPAISSFPRAAITHGYQQFKQEMDKRIIENGITEHARFESFLPAFQGLSAGFDRKMAMMEASAAQASQAMLPSKDRKLLNVIVNYYREDTVDHLSARVVDAVKQSDR